MLKKFISRLVLPRHYWRDLGFDELSELYTAMMFRSLAMSLVGIFIPIYLYLLGYEIWQIFFFYSAVFAIWGLAHYPVAQVVAKIGPKHTILTSYIFQAMTMLMLATQADLRWPLVAIALTLGIGNCLYFVAFHVDFSKVKHREHGGKEVGWLYSMERLGAVLGPLVGGLVAYFIGGEYIFLAAVLLLFAGILPLFLTEEPTSVNQQLKFRELKLGDIKHDLISYGFVHTEQFISMIMWPMFISIFVFRENPYLQLGGIISISVLLSLLVARAIGKTIDEQQGRPLLRFGTIINAVLHLFRPFTTGFPFALGISMANEAVTPSYRMPYLKGMYDAADDLPGRRIVYITAMEATGAAAKGILVTVAGLFAFSLGSGKEVFVGIFIAGAVASLAIMLERYKALDEKA